MDTATLIREARQGSAAAQKCLFDAWADRLLVVCIRYVKLREDAEELLLNGFYKFFKSLQGFHYDNDAGLYSWLKRIMINECLMFLRRRNVFTIVAEINAADMPLEEKALDNLSAAEILHLVLQLPLGYRTVFNLHAIEGYAHHEIATALGINEGTSKSQLSKAKTLLQKMLLQNGIEYATRKQR